jgi:hypothetical protein
MHALVSTLSLFAAFDIVTDSRDELAEMLRAWTAAAPTLIRLVRFCPAVDLG